MPRIRKNIEDAKDDLSYHFLALSNAVRNTKIQFTSIDDLINFALLDIVTGMFHSKPSINKARFIHNLEEILKGIKKYLEEEQEDAIS